MRENFTQRPVSGEIHVIICPVFRVFQPPARLAPALLKTISEIRLTVGLIQLRFAACTPDNKQQQKRIKH
jgi:hypothetical protein